MEIIYILNILCYFCILIFRVKFLSKYFISKYFNPVWISFLFSFPVEFFKVLIGPAFILENGLFDKYYNFAIFMSNIAMIVDALIMYIMFKHTNYDPYKKKVTMNDKSNSYLGVSFLFYMLFLVSFFVLAQHSFGIINWIKNPREGYQYHRVGVGAIWAISISFLSVSFTLFTLFVRKNYLLFLSLPFFFFSAFLLGSKMILLDFGIYFIIVLFLKKYRYLNLSINLGIPIVFSLMIYNFLKNYEEGGIVNIVEYFDYYVNSANYYQAYFQGELPLFKGKIFTSQFWSLVPRGLFPNKPFVYGVLHINEFFFPGAAEATHTPAFGGPVAYFGDFGILGVILLTLLNPLTIFNYRFMCILFKNFEYQIITSDKFLLFCFIWFIAPSFLIQISFPINIIVFALIAGIIKIFLKINIFIIPAIK